MEGMGRGEGVKKKKKEMNPQRGGVGGMDGILAGCKDPVIFSWKSKRSWPRC